MYCISTYIAIQKLRERIIGDAATTVVSDSVFDDKLKLFLNNRSKLVAMRTETENMVQAFTSLAATNDCEY